MRILLLDNYDSFTYNLQHYLEMTGVHCTVVQNDNPLVADEEYISNFRAVVISPGPGRPETAGLLMPFLRSFMHSKPILGICLGHQALGLATGANLEKALRPMHGKTSRIRHDGHGVFSGLPDEISVCRYHSLVLKNINTEQWQISATTGENEIMGIRHKTLPLEGVQFHPEAILTENGHRMTENWIQSLR